MYKAIQLSPEITNSILESISPKINEGSISNEEIQNKIFTEAVFVNGKNTVQPIEECFNELKNILEDSIKDQIDSSKSDKKGKYHEFDPVKYWKNLAWKKLEDELKEIFGFRNVEVHPIKERYLTKDKMFESKELNACVYNDDRYPIDGLISDKGFYDKTHSINIQLYFTLGIIKNLTPSELVAVLLHEFGHSIDPALVHISYTETNLLTKYLTDRANKLTKEENRLLDKFKKVLGINASDKKNSIINFISLALTISIPGIIDGIKEKFIGKEKVLNSKLRTIQKLIQKDDSEFNRKNFSEAFADNFARMYGYGNHLVTALEKFDENTDFLINSRFKKEKLRQEVIISITKDLIKDVHKTDVHRIRSLIAEYKADIEDPNTCPEVKKQLQSDLEELEKIFDEYLNHFSDFQNRVNKMINDELQKKEDEKNKN